MFTVIAAGTVTVEADEEAAPRYCEAQTYRATRIDPAEFCDSEAEEGSDYCQAHAGADEDMRDYEPDDDIDQNYWIERDSEDLWHDSGE